MSALLRIAVFPVSFGASITSSQNFCLYLKRTTSLDNTAAINARLAEIGDTYKDLGPYDTWKPITGLDYASYNPATGKADYTENGVKIVLPKGAN